MTIPAIRVGDAIMALSGLGYEIGLEGGVIKYKYMGTSPRDADLVRPLLQTIRSSREEAMLFLRIYCPRCGGMVFATDQEGRESCLRCHFERIRKSPLPSHGNRAAKEDETTSTSD
jgi:ribosomal protein S27AE